MKCIHIEATTLPDAWFQAVYELLNSGRSYTIDRGSFEGDKRLQYDFFSCRIKNPGYPRDRQSLDDLTPKLPGQYNIPDPVAPGYVIDYLPYLLTGEEKEGESYTYGQRLTKSPIDIGLGHNYKVFKDILIQDEAIWNDDNIYYRESTDLNKRFLNQVELFIWIYKNIGHGTNQNVLQVAEPNDAVLQDPPCLRHIDTAIIDGKLHFYPVFRSWDLWCVDEETEILTTFGWKHIDNISEHDFVATLNQTTNKMEYCTIDGINIAPYIGDMMYIKTKRVDQLVTPNHRILHKYVSHSGNTRVVGNYQYSEAQKIIPKDGSFIPLTAQYSGGDRPIGNESKAALIGWILTDSYYKPNCNTIEIYQSESKYVDDIRNLLNGLGISFSESVSERTYYKIVDKIYPKGHKCKLVTFRISASDTRWIKNIVPDRRPTFSLLKSPLNERFAMFEAMIKADGTIRVGRNQTHSYIFWSKDKEKRDWFQLLAFSLGFNALINDKKGCVNISNKTESMIRRNHFDGTSLPIIKYSGRVWCVQTKNSNFVMRRNGKISITGNSGFPANLAAIQVLKEYMATEIGVEDGEMVVSSPKLHMYRYVWELAECIRGKTIEEFRSESN